MTFNLGKLVQTDVLQSLSIKLKIFLKTPKSSNLRTL